MKLSEGERLITLMLCDLFKHLKVESDIDPDFVTDAIHGGHLWALEWEYTGIFHGDDTKEPELEETGEILAMWSVLEHAYSKLDEAGRTEFKEAVGEWPSEVKFCGFDGNNESRYMSIARFMIDKMDRFVEFKGRYLNAHMPTLDMHRRMLRVFRSGRGMTYDSLSFDGLVAIVKEQVHPENRGKAA